MPRFFTSAAKFFAASRVSAGDVEVDDDAGVEIDAVEHALQRFERAVEAVAIGVDRALADERQPGRAVFQIVQRLLVGGGRIGMIDALHALPTACPARAPRPAGRLRRAA